MKTPNETMIRNLICCPICKGNFLNEGNSFDCPKCNSAYELDGHLLMNRQLKLSATDQDSREKWNALYSNQTGETLAEERSNYRNDEYATLRKQIETYKPIDQIIYAEIGCGPMYFGQLIASECKLVIGIDYSLKAIKDAELLFNKLQIDNYFLIFDDIRLLPIKNESIDLIFGGGVIEHFKDTQECVNELHRVLNPGGVSFNTVPALNIGSLTYRQLWGNIPNIPILKTLFEFIHVRLLKSKLLTYGYELSFLSKTLKSIHKRAGFKRIYISRYQVNLVLEFLPAPLRPFFRELIKRVNWLQPMHKVVGIK